MLGGLLGAGLGHSGLDTDGGCGNFLKRFCRRRRALDLKESSTHVIGPLDQVAQLLEAVIGHIWRSHRFCGADAFKQSLARGLGHLC